MYGRYNVRKFYLDRILRIYPLFVLIVSFGYLSTPDPRPTTTGVDFILALLPISNLYRLDYGAFGGQMWTVAVELQFYLLFPLLLAFRRRSTRFAFFGGIIALATALRAAQFATNGTVHQFAFFTLFGTIDLFVGGMLASEVYAKLKERSVYLRSALVCRLRFDHHGGGSSCLYPLLVLPCRLSRHCLRPYQPKRPLDRLAHGARSSLGNPASSVPPIAQAACELPVVGGGR